MRRKKSNLTRNFFFMLILFMNNYPCLDISKQYILFVFFFSL